jgi:hypothetical protein
MRNKVVGIGEGVGLILFFVGTGIQLRWPEWKGLGTAFMVFGAIAALGIALWVVAQYFARKEFQATALNSAPAPRQRLSQTGIGNEFMPQNVFSPTVRVNVPVNQKQSHGQTEPPKTRSVFEATDNTRIVTYAFDGHTAHLIREPYYGREEDLPNHISIINVALAQFHYRHDAGVEPSLHVSAHLFAHDSERKPLKPLLYHTIWDNSDLDRQISFSAGKVHDLIVALFRRENPESIVLYEHARETEYGTDVIVRPKIHEVKGKDFYIKIELTPKRWNDPLPKQTFWFRLALQPEPMIVKIKEPAPEGIRFRKASD